MSFSRDKVISTFGEYMVCPFSLQGSDLSLAKISKIGLADFEKYKYIHESKVYRGDTAPDENMLLKEIENTIVSLLNKSNKIPLLLLSDGKDSMGLALALSESKIKCKTLTLLRSEDSELKKYISGVAMRLGHDPHFISVDEILSGYDNELFLKACGTMKSPVLDQGLLFFLMGCSLFFSKEGLDSKEYVLIDGLGNDEHFGYLPSKHQRNAFRLSQFNIWKILPKKKIPCLRWFIRSPAEAHGDLSALSAFFPFGKSFDLNCYFSKVPKSIEEITFIDFRAFSRGAFHDHQCMMGKTIATAKSLGCDVIFPWADKDLADFCFNLPISSKFDYKNLKNKLLLRDLLSNSLGWKQEKRGVDLYFDLDLNNFKENVLKKNVPDEIINVIDSSKFIPLSVKRRAYLELNNFYGYCKVNGLEECTIKNILFGND